jgi:hypothetical protein
VLGSCWQSSEHCRFRATEEIGKAVRAPLLWLRVHHLEAAAAWYARADAIGGTGLWDRLAAARAELDDRGGEAPAH